MGEYVKHNGELLKLGTCEDLYYVTFRQAQLVCAGAQFQEGNLPPAEYLNPRHGWRYRFPFPDEDNAAPGSFKQYERGAAVYVDPATVAEVDHGTLCHSTGNGYNVNVFIPCPATFKKLLDEHEPCPKHSGVPAKYPIEIVQQKQMEDGALWTVCQCGWCKAKFRLPPDEGLALAKQIRAEHPDKTDGCTAYWLEIANRIEAGYARRVAVSV